MLSATITAQQDRIASRVDRLQTKASRGSIHPSDMPAGAQIGTLGTRNPVAHTVTTRPALAK